MTQGVFNEAASRQLATAAQGALEERAKKVPRPEVVQDFLNQMVVALHDRADPNTTVPHQQNWLKDPEPTPLMPLFIQRFSEESVPSDTSVLTALLEAGVATSIRLVYDALHHQRFGLLTQLLERGVPMWDPTQQTEGYALAHGLMTACAHPGAQAAWQAMEAHPQVHLMMGGTRMPSSQHGGWLHALSGTTGRALNYEEGLTAEAVRPWIDRALRWGARLDDHYNHGNTPLFVACAEHVPLAICQALLGAGADPNQGTTFGLKPLHHAASVGRLDKVQVLLAAGADPSAANKWGDTPLMEAAVMAEPAVVQALLAAGADPHSRRVLTNTDDVLTALTGLLRRLADRTEDLDDAQQQTLDLLVGQGLTYLEAANHPEWGINMLLAQAERPRLAAWHRGQQLAADMPERPKTHRPRF